MAEDSNNLFHQTMGFALGVGAMCLMQRELGRRALAVNGYPIPIVVAMACVAAPTSERDQLPSATVLGVWKAAFPVQLGLWRSNPIYDLSKPLHLTAFLGQAHFWMLSAPEFHAEPEYNCFLGPLPMLFERLGLRTPDSPPSRSDVYLYFSLWAIPTLLEALSPLTNLWATAGCDLHR